MLPRHVMITRQFRGLPSSGNGGYAVGLLAEAIGTVCDARLKAPPPLDTPMARVGDENGFQLMLGDVVIAEGRPTSPDWPVPEPVPFPVADAASAAFRGFSRHRSPQCFVCGPERHVGYGLRIFPGPVEGSDLVATVWRPDQAFIDAGGQVSERVMWAALDCPSYFALADSPSAVLGRMRGSVETRPTSGKPLIVLGWPGVRDGRKRMAGSAIFSDGGALLASSEAVWVEVSELPLPPR